MRPAAVCTPKKHVSFYSGTRDRYTTFVGGIPGCDHLYWTDQYDLSHYLFVFFPDGDELHLRICVDDDVHKPVMDKVNSWEGDGVQLLLQFPWQAGLWEVNFAVSEDLAKSVCNVQAAPAGFDGAALSDCVSVSASRNPDVPSKTLWYEVRLPFKAFGLSRERLFAEGLRCNVMVNDRDADRREGFMSLIPGEPKDPDNFLRVLFRQ